MALYADGSSFKEYLSGCFDGNFRRVFKKRVTNDLSLILRHLEPFRQRPSGDCRGIHLQLVLACGWSDGCRLQRRPPGQSIVPSSSMRD